LYQLNNFLYFLYIKNYFYIFFIYKCAGVIDIEVHIQEKDNEDMRGKNIKNHNELNITNINKFL
jgi:hypothetical protein